MVSVLPQLLWGAFSSGLVAWDQKQQSKEQRQQDQLLNALNAALSWQPDPIKLPDLPPPPSMTLPEDAVSAQLVRGMELRRRALINRQSITDVLEG